jgi:ComF family protein
VRTPDGITLCQACEDLPPEFDHALAALDYEQPWSSLIAALKFQRDLALARPLAALLAQAVKQRWALPVPAGSGPARGRQGAGRHAPPLVWRRGAPTVLVPVPLSRQRLIERGYNQAEVLADQLGRLIQRPVLADALHRTRHTERLMTMDADARQLHIRGAFEVSAARLDRVAGQHVAVVDDVLTTGATLNEVARTLWLAGAREVSVWVVARTPLHDPAPTRPPHRPPLETAWADTQLLAD